ncbi:hypothetical protein HFO86_34735 [Rhizobium leguminosarum]|nr:hypothetical protein [Rhizobium leguminosarum]
MTVSLKIRADLLARVRADLERPHPFAWERVGFLFAAAAAMSERDLLLTIRRYIPVDDDDYVIDRKVGARIGSNAMRKAVEAAYRPASGILHVHTHHGSGVPSFSSVDLASASEFVPGFFETAPRMPHGLLVLSDDAAYGHVWFDARRDPKPIDHFVSVGVPINHQWSAG